ncbi:MAG: hypothetical protein ACRC3I_03800 [Cetobacterium sp.]
MIIDRSKLYKIGIDRVVINNFKILNFDKLDKKHINSKSELIERFEEKNDFAILNYSVAINEIGELYTTASLDINPNKIRDNHNVYNSNVFEFHSELNKVVKLFKENGIELDLSEARIKQIEINITFLKKYENLKEVLLLIGRANPDKAIGIYSFTTSDIPREIVKDRTLYINGSKGDIAKTFEKDILRKKIILYDKTFEVLTKTGVELKDELFRAELHLGRDYYREQISNYGLTNSIFDLKDEILKDIFIKSLEKELKVEPLKYLEVIKKKLKLKFLNFKRNENVKKQERIKLKSLGKEIPELYRETRGVFEYLDKEAWIFDYSFLQELVLEKIDSKSRQKYLKQIENKYLDKNNKEVYEELLKTVFPR